MKYLQITTSTDDAFRQVETAIREEHNYDLPQIIATENVGGRKDYLKWLGGECPTVSTLLKFRAILHAADRTDFDTTESIVNKVACRCLQIQQSDLQPFHCTFEDAFSALEKLHRMFVELDGSFVWVGDQDGSRWQLDGVLYDWGGQLQHVDLQGHCFPEQLEQLLACLVGQQANVVFQLPELSLYLSDSEFRKVSQVSQSQ
ncbi:MAG: hypothetical protein ACI9HK_000450 [Pirellulaceae bacterium]